jgi:ligand-binding sensor domain-containing protein
MKTIFDRFKNLKMQSMQFGIAFCIVILFSLNTVQAQIQQCRIYNTDNSGLPHNQVTSIAIDAQGNKWFGTFYGEVVKFDDVNWTVYNNTNSGLPGLYRISSIVIDAKDNKWIGTSFTPTLGNGGGLVKFDNTKWTVYNKSNSGLPNNTVRGVAIDIFGNKWIGTWGGGVAKFDDTKWTVYLSSNSIFAVEADAWGNKWFATWNAILKFDDTKWTVYNYSKSIIPYYNGNGGINTIAIDDEGNKWFGISEDWDTGDNGGVAKFDDVDWTIYSSYNSDLQYSVHSIAIDKEGNKWFGTSYWDKGALVKFDGSNWTVYNNTNYAFPDDWIESIAIDDQGNKWIATGNSGVVVFNENGLKTGVNNTTTGLSNKMPDKSDFFTLYPNPAKDFITIEGLPTGTFEIINSAGDIIKNSEVQGMPTQVDISNFPGGIYTLRITTKDQVFVKKFIKTS